MAKRFTLVEAQSLIPEVDRLLRQALDAKAEYQDAEQVIREFTERVMMMGGVIVDRDRALEARARELLAADAISAGRWRIEACAGCTWEDVCESGWGALLAAAEAAARAHPGSDE